MRPVEPPPHELLGAFHSQVGACFPWFLVFIASFGCSGRSACRRKRTHYEGFHPVLEIFMINLKYGIYLRFVFPIITRETVRTNGACESTPDLPNSHRITAACLVSCLSGFSQAWHWQGPQASYTKATWVTPLRHFCLIPSPDSHKTAFYIPWKTVFLKNI